MTTAPTTMTEAEIEPNAVRFFSENVDGWGAAEWFDRLAKAIRAQDNAVVAKDDIGFETYRMIAASSAMTLVRGHEATVRGALSAAPPAPAPDDLRELREAAERATPGPWAKSGFTIDRVISADDNHHTICFTMAELSGPPFEQRLANAAFIARANPSTVLSLIARIARLESENARLREAVRSAEEEFCRIDCEGVTETRSILGVMDRVKFFARRGAEAARAAVSEQKP